MVALQLGIYAVIAGGVLLDLASNKPSPVQSAAQTAQNVQQTVQTASQPQPGGFLASAASWVEYIQWTEDANHALSGTVLTTYIADSQGTMQSHSVALTGTLNGSDITLTLQEGLGVTASFTGTLNGDTLTLAVPNGAGCLYNSVYQRAPVQEYNTEVDALRGRAANGQGPYVPSASCNG
jgi:hypothetical protein